MTDSLMDGTVMSELPTSPIPMKKKTTGGVSPLKSMVMKKKTTLMQQREDAAKQKKASRFGVAGAVSILYFSNELY